MLCVYIYIYVHLLIHAHMHTYTLASHGSEALMTFIRLVIKTGHMAPCGAHVGNSLIDQLHTRKVPSQPPCLLSCPQIRSPALSSHPPHAGFNETGSKGHCITALLSMCVCVLGSALTCSNAVLICVLLWCFCWKSSEVTFTCTLRCTLWDPTGGSHTIS